MRNAAWIWFTGCAVWVADALIQLHYRALPRARLAFAVATMFLAAGIFYRKQKP